MNISKLGWVCCTLSFIVFVLAVGVATLFNNFIEANKGRVVEITQPSYYGNVTIKSYPSDNDSIVEELRKLEIAIGIR